MDIETLRLIVHEADLIEILQRFPKDGPIRHPVLTIEPGGARLKGKYAVGLIPIPFDTFWTATVQHGRLLIRPAQISVVGLPAGLLQGVFMNGIKKGTVREAGIQVDRDHVEIHLEELLRARGIPLRANLRDVTFHTGQIILTAGP